MRRRRGGEHAGRSWMTFPSDQAISPRAHGGGQRPVSAGGPESSPMTAERSDQHGELPQTLSNPLKPPWQWGDANLTAWPLRAANAASGQEPAVVVAVVVAVHAVRGCTGRFTPGSNAQVNPFKEPRRTGLNAIMTAWQCGGQGFESPQLHPSDQAVLRFGGGLRRLRRYVLSERAGGARGFVDMVGGSAPVCVRARSAVRAGLHRWLAQGLQSQPMATGLSPPSRVRKRVASSGASSLPPAP